MAKRGFGMPPKSAPPLPDRAVRRPAAAPSSPTPAKRKAPSKAENKPAPPNLPAAPKDEVPEDLQVVFGKNLKAARLKCGLKQSELAERTGLTQQYLSLIETGHQNLTLKTMMALAQVVGHNVSDMLRQSPKVRLPAR
jgi:DNA-binding XRE family transcriptional regulator